MEPKYRYMFTLCLIMGFQIHVPVTMFPATGANDEHPDLAGVFADNTFDVSLSLSISEPLKPFEGINKDHHSGEFVRDGLIEKNPRIQGPNLSAIDLKSVPKGGMNSIVNQASRADIDKFNTDDGLNGLERDFSAYDSKSSKSVTNPLEVDLSSDRVQYLERRLANISKDLITRKNILQNNERKILVNELDTNADVVDKHNKDIVITSKQLTSPQNSKFESSSNTAHGRNENNVNGILWSDALVNKCPGGFSEGEIAIWKQKLQNLTVVKIEPGCGSMQNRLITFSDTSKACVRYRLNSDQMQGDIYSFYLGKLLNMRYTPPTTLQMLDNKQLWENVIGDVISAKWSSDRPLIISEWVDALEPVFMPVKLKDMKGKLHFENYHLNEMPLGELCDLVQWSDLMVFDYISANLDRVVNNLFNLQWNHKMLEKPIHNLERSTRTGQLVFLDNESGLFHGYRLLDAYETYQKSLLDRICIFKPSTLQAVKQLYMAANTGELLQREYEENEPYHSHLPRMSKQNMKILQSRISTVYKHMEMCEHIR